MSLKIVATDRPMLESFDGQDAMLQATDDLKDKVVKFANAAMPQVLRKALFILQNSQNEKSVLEAAKLIKLISDGNIKGRQIEASVKKFSNEQIAKVLNGHSEGED